MIDGWFDVNNTLNIVCIDCNDTEITSQHSQRLPQYQMKMSKWIQHIYQHMQ